MECACGGALERLHIPVAFLFPCQYLLIAFGCIYLYFLPLLFWQIQHVSCTFWQKSPFLTSSYLINLFRSREFQLWVSLSKQSQASLSATSLGVGHLSTNVHLARLILSATSDPAQDLRPSGLNDGFKQCRWVLRVLPLSCEYLAQSQNNNTVVESFEYQIKWWWPWWCWWCWR